MLVTCADILELVGAWKDLTNLLYTRKHINWDEYCQAMKSHDFIEQKAGKKLTRYTKQTKGN